MDTPEFQVLSDLQPRSEVDLYVEISLFGDGSHEVDVESARMTVLIEELVRGIAVIASHEEYRGCSGALCGCILRAQGAGRERQRERHGGAHGQDQPVC